jgi:hypothetical protein
VDGIKKREQFLDPDPCSMAMGPPIEQQYEMIGYFDLHKGVPESVRSYMSSVVTLWLYGWLYYPFYAHVVFLSATAVEMALKERLPKVLNRKGRDPRGLHDLLIAAKAEGLLRDEGFPSLQRRREAADEIEESVPETSAGTAVGQAEESYVDRLVEYLPRIRNAFAHPKMNSILPPGMVVDSLIIAAEIINQLWEKPHD